MKYCVKLIRESNTYGITLIALVINKKHTKFIENYQHL